MSICRQTIRTFLTAVLPRRKLLVRGPNSGGEARIPSSGERKLTRQIALTFDDGPHPEQTPRLLDQLAGSQIRATFFVIGQRAEQHPLLIRRMVEEGHVLGNHTFTHGEPNETSARKFLEEVQRTQSLLEDIAGQECRLMRPPKGKLTLRKLWGLWQGGQTVVLWNVDPRDYRMHSHQEMQDWIRHYHPSGGDIVLLHDNHPFAATAVNLLSGFDPSSNLSFVPVTHWLPAPQEPLNTEPCPVP